MDNFFSAHLNYQIFPSHASERSYCGIPLQTSKTKILLVPLFVVADVWIIKYHLKLIFAVFKIFLNLHIYWTIINWNFIWNIDLNNVKLYSILSQTFLKQIFTTKIKTIVETVCCLVYERSKKYFVYYVFEHLKYCAQINEYCLNKNACLNIVWMEKDL